MVLSTHTLKPARGAKHSPKVVGRGNASGHGTSSTRGGKGQTARSGGSRGLRLKGFKRLLQSTPKLRGFKSLATKPVTITIDVLERKFSANEVVSVATLQTKGLLSKNDVAAKIVDGKNLTKKLTVEGLKLSAGAKAKIEAAGGSVK